MKKLICMILMIILVLGCVCGAVAETELTWLLHWEEPGLKAWAQELCDNFNATHPGVKIVTENVGNDQFQQMLQMKIASDDAPIIFDLGSYDLYKSFSEAGHLYDLTGQPCLENVDPTMLNEAVIDGKMWGVTFSKCTEGTVFYNKDVFAEAGVEIPTTYPEFIAVCEALKAKGVVPIAAPFAQAWTIDHMAHAYIIPFCWYKDITWPEKKVGLQENFADDAGFKAAMEKFFSLVPYFNDDPFGTTWENAQSMLAFGECAMLINGSWTLEAVVDKNPDVNIGVFPLPHTDNAEDTMMIMRPGSGLSVFNDPDPERLAVGVEFLNYINSVEAGTIFSQRAIQISTVMGIDFSFNDVLLDLISYPNTFTDAGVKRWVSEYTNMFTDLISDHILSEDYDVDKLAAEMDEAFTAAAD